MKEPTTVFARFTFGPDDHTCEGDRRACACATEATASFAADTARRLLEHTGPAGHWAVFCPPRSRKHSYAPAPAWFSQDTGRFAAPDITVKFDLDTGAGIIENGPIFSRIFWMRHPHANILLSSVTEQHLVPYLMAHPDDQLTTAALLRKSTMSVAQESGTRARAKSLHVAVLLPIADRLLKEAGPLRAQQLIALLPTWDGTDDELLTVLEHANT